MLVVLISSYLYTFTMGLIRCQWCIHMVKYLSAFVGILRMMAGQSAFFMVDTFLPVTMPPAGQLI